MVPEPGIWDVYRDAMQSVRRGIEGPRSHLASRNADRRCEDATGPVTALVQLDPRDARHLAELAAQRGLTLPQFLYETAMTQLCVA